MLTLVYTLERRRYSYSPLNTQLQPVEYYVQSAGSGRELRAGYPPPCPPRTSRPAAGVLRRLQDALEEEGGVGDDRGLGEELLRRIVGDGEHREAAVVELLELEVALHGGGLAHVELEGVKAEVARHVVGTALRVERGGLNGGREDDDAHEEERVDLVEAAVEDRGRLVARGEQVRGAERLGQPRLHELRHRPAGRGEHRQAAVLELGLAVALERLERGRAVEGVEALVAHEDRGLAVGEDRVRLQQAQVDGVAHV